MAEKNELAEIICEYRNVARNSDSLLAGTFSNHWKTDALRVINSDADIPDVSCAICYYIAGTGRYEVFDGRIIPFFPGKIIVWNAECIRKKQFHDPGLYVEKYILFPGELYRFLKKFQSSGESLIEMDIGINPDIARKFDDLADELDNQIEKKLPETAIHMLEFLLSLISTPPNMDWRQISKLEEAARILESNTGQNLSMRQIATKLNLGCSTFQHIFTEYYSIPPAQYRIRRKIEKIQQHLAENKYTLKELAVKFGYANPFALSKQFKKYTGLSPKDYRAAAHVERGIKKRRG